MDTEIHKTHISGGRTLPRAAIATLTFVIFMSLTLVSWSVVQDLEERHENSRFDKVIAEAIHKIEHHFSGYEQVLKGGLGHLLASPSVSRNEWRTYVNALRINDRYPGIHGIGFAKYIPSSRLAAHTEEVRAEGDASEDTVLGWWRLQTRVSEVKYWFKVCLMEDTRLVRGLSS